MVPAGNPASAEDTSEEAEIPHWLCKYCLVLILGLQATEVVLL